VVKCASGSHTRCANVRKCRRRPFVLCRGRIQGGIYCCYDAFSRSDVRCELTVPGGSQSYVINRDGQREDDVSQEVCVQP